MIVKEVVGEVGWSTIGDFGDHEARRLDILNIDVFVLHFAKSQFYHDFATWDRVVLRIAH